MEIANNAMVTLRCRVHDEAGELLDDGSRPFSYRHGCGMLLSAVERAIAGRTAGYAVTVGVGAEQAYGARRDELVFEAARENLPPGVQLEPGMTLRSSGGPFPLRVVSLTERGAMLDGNHPLAGRGLTFQVEVIDVQPPAATEPADVAGCGSATGCSSQCSGRCPA